MKEQKQNKDKQHSLRHYEYLRHKIEEEENRWKRRGEIRKVEDQQIDGNLRTFSQKMSRGQSIAEDYRREIRSRASKMSAHEERTLH